ncbi:hypothetical protein MKZ38_007515 [Zalerion maritima]|uniref:Uncharacterized protein n=1 Tax=Zalerion maritima TaxID=339359 RepID=A0AAD5RHZ9_9PEZI|nr:hypothetical protein MKZ38_007515 [Zalerion maritima]
MLENQQYILDANNGSRNGTRRSRRHPHPRGLTTVAQTKRLQANQGNTQGNTQGNAQGSSDFRPRYCLFSRLCLGNCQLQPANQPHPAHISSSHGAIHLQTQTAFISPRADEASKLGSLPIWSQNPIPGVSLSAGGLLALADLSTVAQRTALAGGASWLDALLLAPGLHYQQAADALVKDFEETAVSTGSGSESGGVPRAGTGAVSAATGAGLRRRGVGGTTGPGHGNGSRTSLLRHDLVIRNAATASYLRRISKAGTTVTLDVGCILSRRRRNHHRDAGGLWRRTIRGGGERKDVGGDGDADCIDDIVAGMQDLGRLSNILYLSSPVLTVAAVVFMVLFKDFWGLAAIVALMVSRILNIAVIKRRTVRAPPTRPNLKRSFLNHHPPRIPGDPEATDGMEDEDNDDDNEEPATYLVSFPCPLTGRRNNTFPTTGMVGAEDTAYTSGMDTPATWGGQTPNPAGLTSGGSFQDAPRENTADEAAAPGLSARTPSNAGAAPSAVVDKKVVDKKASSWPPAHRRSPNQRTGTSDRHAGDPSSPAHVVLRGRPSDLEAITSTPFLRQKTHMEGYAEAAAKLCVYAVASLSGNVTQAGAIILMALLLSSAALLGLSNSYARGMKVNGRLAVPVEGRGGQGKGRTERGGGGMWVSEGEAVADDDDGGGSGDGRDYGRHEGRNGDV